MPVSTRGVSHSQEDRVMDVTHTHTMAFQSTGTSLSIADWDYSIARSHTIGLPT